MRLDLYITQKFPNITRSQAKRLIEDGCVKLNGVVFQKPAHKVCENDDINVSIPPFPKGGLGGILPEDIPITVIYEDPDIIVVNKSAGMVVHPAAGNYNGTLVNALLAHCKDLSGIGGELRPGIVHRLDKGTSGVMVVAKNDLAHANISAQFKERTVEKRYYALVYGKVPKENGMIALPIGRHVSERKKMSVKTRRGRTAETHYKVIKRFGSELTLLDIRLGTGRTHQIRVHFSHLGHPLVGDDLYGGVKAIKRLKNNNLIEIIKLFSRPALHAYKLGFKHPRTSEKMEFKAPVPEDLSGLLQLLERGT